MPQTQQTSDPVYLDHAATTPAAPEVVRTLAEASEHCFGNPSSAHGFGTRSQRALEDAREFLRGALGAASVVFTGSGSEADMLGVTGAAWMRPPGRALAAASDHPAILAQSTVLARTKVSRGGVHKVPVTRHGDIDPEALFDHLGPDVRVVSLLYGHNELGTIPDLEESVEVIRRVAPECHIHVDLVQAFGKVPFDLAEIDVDSVAVSAHKIHGPKGVGALGLAHRAKVAPITPAGGQEHGLRGGTQDVPGAVAFAAAAERALSSHTHTAAHTEALAARMMDRLATAFPDAERLGNPARRLPHILSVRIPGVNGETLVQRCAKRGVACSAGAACHGAGEQEGDKAKGHDNHVLHAIGLDRRTARTVVRFSFARTNTMAEVEHAAELVAEEALALDALAVRPRKSSRRASGSTPLATRTR